MRVLGVDPGLTRCGLGVVDSAADRTLSAVAVGVVRTSPDLAPELRLLAVAEGIEAWIAEHRPDVVAVERVFAQQNVRSVTGTSQVAGIAMLAAARLGIAVALHTPSEVKAAVTGSGRAEKAQVQEMVRRILRLSEAPRPADAADALALAVCHVWRGSRTGLAPVQAAVRGAAASGGAAPAGAPALTAAQRVWAEAERAARRPPALARRR